MKFSFKRSAWLKNNGKWGFLEGNSQSFGDWHTSGQSRVSYSGKRKGLVVERNGKVDFFRGRVASFFNGSVNTFVRRKWFKF